MVGERIVEEILENPGIPVTQLGVIVNEIIKRVGKGDNSVKIANDLNSEIISNLGRIQTAKPVMRVRGTRYGLAISPYYRMPLTPKAVSRIAKEYYIYSTSESSKYDKKFEALGIAKDPNFPVWNIIPDKPEYFFIYDKNGNIDFGIDKDGKPKGAAKKIMFSVEFVKRMGENNKAGILGDAYRKLMSEGKELNKKNIWEALKEVAGKTYKEKIAQFRKRLYGAKGYGELENIERKGMTLKDYWNENYKKLNKARELYEQYKPTKKSRKKAALAVPATSEEVEYDIDNAMDDLVENMVGDIVESSMGVVSDATEYYENPLTVNKFINEAVYSIVYGVIKQSYDTIINVLIDKIGLDEKMAKKDAVSSIMRLIYPVAKNAVLYGMVEHLGEKTSREASEFMKNILVYETVKELDIFGFNPIPKIKYANGKVNFSLKKGEVSNAIDSEVAIPMDNYLEGEPIDKVIDENVNEYTGEEQLTYGNKEEIVELEVSDEIGEMIVSGEVDALDVSEFLAEEQLTHPQKSAEEETTEFKL